MNLLQFDDFAPDAASMRVEVIEGGFSTQTGPDGAKYTGISLHSVPHWFDRVSELLNKKIIPKLSCFRVNLAGELPHSWVHSDDICAKYASVLYLNRPQECKGGTAFWKHDKLNLDHLPTREELGDQAESFYEMMTSEWKNLTHWKQISFVPMKWNRFITYPTCFFHSRYPFEGFGTGPRDGRLIWVCFYDIVGEA